MAKDNGDDTTRRRALELPDNLKQLLRKLQPPSLPQPRRDPEAEAKAAEEAEELAKARRRLMRSTAIRDNLIRPPWMKPAPETATGQSTGVAQGTAAGT